MLVQSMFTKLYPRPSPSSWLLFQHGSQSSTALHDFITKSEVQPPDAYHIWYQVLVRFNVHHSQPVRAREFKRFNAALKKWY